MILGFRKNHLKRMGGKPTGFIGKIKAGIKITTFREDKHKRWRAGMSIQFYEGNHHQKRRKFWKDNTCKSVQEVYILNHNNKLHIEIGNKDVYPNNYPAIAKNDGFNSLDDFIQHFVPTEGSEWSGRIIHWTGTKY